MAKFKGMDSLHLLKVWIDANTSQAQFARDVKCSESYLSDILAGKREPSLAMAARMSAQTAGAVPIDAFVIQAEAAQ